MILGATFNDRNLKFVNTSNLHSALNIFTIIVGKNGTGKSRLLGNIASTFMEEFDTGSLKWYSRSRVREAARIKYSSAPQKCIAVSTSPFDRFPLHGLYEKRASVKYSYVGIRELRARNFGLAYMAKIVAGLIEVVALKSVQIDKIMRVLNYLGYTDRIDIHMQNRISEGFIRNVIELGPKYFDEDKGNRRMVLPSLNNAFFYNEDGSVSKEKVTQLVKILKLNKKSPLFEEQSVLLKIDRNGLDTNPIYTKKITDLLFLIKCGVFRLRDITLAKLDSLMPFSITDASSGEQSVVISILGIASQIEDNSIICIDEPEICLHPEWQERYMKLLTSTFAMYRECHFIIATHSPQIVSNLEPENSYVLSLETGETTDAREYIRHSSDFQLANVFQSPGFKNEYLSRIALNTFAKVSRYKFFDEEDIANLTLLQNLQQSLSIDDPVYQLYQALNEMYDTYGGN
jgi:predicted ATPase